MAEIALCRGRKSIHAYLLGATDPDDKYRNTLSITIPAVTPPPVTTQIADFADQSLSLSHSVARTSRISIILRFKVYEKGRAG